MTKKKQRKKLVLVMTIVFSLLFGYISIFYPLLLSLSTSTYSFLSFIQRAATANKMKQVIISSQKCLSLILNKKTMTLTRSLLSKNKSITKNTSNSKKTNTL